MESPDPEHRRLRRLDRVWQAQPIYFITTCTHRRRSILAQPVVFEILVDEWTCAQERHRWSVGRFVVMPDHVHFFCRPARDGGKRLSEFMAAWKQWTAKRIAAALSIEPPIWQKMFFDHLIRGSESYDQKWQYVFSNPVRHGLAATPDAWPWSGKVEGLTW